MNKRPSEIQAGMTPREPRPSRRIIRLIIIITGRIMKFDVSNGYQFTTFFFGPNEDVASAVVAAKAFFIITSDAL